MMKISKGSLVGLMVLSPIMVMAPSLAHAKTPKLGFILSTLQEERYQRDKQIFEETAKSLGATTVFASANNSEQTQASEVENLLSQGVDAIIIQPVNGDTASAFVKQAKEDGVPVVDYDRLINNAPIDAYVKEDAVRTGELQAEAAAKFTHYKGNYILLMGQAGHSCAEERTEGVLNVLKKYPNIKLVVKQYHNAWSPNLAMQTTENALTRFHNDIQAVIANNSGMAHGALQAIEEQKLAGKIYLAGADADLANLRDMVAGKQQFEVQISIHDMAEKATRTAYALAMKQPFPFDMQVNNGMVSVKTINTPVYPIERETIEARIVKTGFQTHEAIYGGTASSK